MHGPQATPQDETAGTRRPVNEDRSMYGGTRPDDPAEALTGDVGENERISDKEDHDDQTNRRRCNRLG